MADDTHMQQPDNEASVNSESVAEFQQRIRAHVDGLVANTLTKIISAAPAGADLNRINFDRTYLENQIEQTVFKALTTPQRVHIDSPSYVLPYQHLVPDSVRGMDLVQLANFSDVGRKLVPYNLVATALDPSCHQYSVPQKNIPRINCQALTAQFWGTDQKQVPQSANGPHENSILFRILWGALSPPVQHLELGYPFRKASYCPPDLLTFDLVQAVLTARKCGVSKKQTLLPLKKSLFYAHRDNTPRELLAQNDVANLEPLENPHKHGNMFYNAIAIANAWNGFMNEVHGKPAKGSDEYAQMQHTLFTEDDVHQTLACISAIVHADFAQAEKEADLCWSGRQSAQPAKYGAIARLHRHICFLQTTEDLEWALYQQEQAKVNPQQGPYAARAQQPDEQQARSVLDDTQLKLKDYTKVPYPWVGDHFVHKRSVRRKPNKSGQ